MSRGNRRPRGGALPIVVRMMLAHNKLAGWDFESPGPEYPHPSGKGHIHIHVPSWIDISGSPRTKIPRADCEAYEIVWPPESN